MHGRPWPGPDSGDGRRPPSAATTMMFQESSEVFLARAEGFFGLNRGNAETRLQCTSILFLRLLRYCPFCLSREEVTVVAPDCAT